jgi:hypothetical protein
MGSVFLEFGTAFGKGILSCKRSPVHYLKEQAMKSVKNKVVVFLAVAIGGMVGLVKGEEAKQKWVFRIRSKYENRRLVAERKSIARKGGVLLDDIEMASYHKN